MHHRQTVTAILALLSVLPSSMHAQPTQAASKAMVPPGAKIQYAPDRDYDLQHVLLDLRVDWENRAFQGLVTHTLAPLREGLATVRLHCSGDLRIDACETGGKALPFSHTGDLLEITLATPAPRGKSLDVSVRYSGGKENAGWQWVKTGTSVNPSWAGFWTAGQPQKNRG